MDPTARVVPETQAPFPWAEPFLSIGVTGTNGKTSTTLMVSSVLLAAGHGVVTDTTLGYEVDGKPVVAERSLAGFHELARRAAARGTRHAALEVTSHSLCRGYAKLWRFQIGVFTNLTRDHLNDHGSFEHYLASKTQLFLHLPASGVAVLNAADPSAALIDRVIPRGVRRLYYATRSRGALWTQPHLLSKAVRVSVDGTDIELESSPLSDKFGGRLSTPLVGEVFAENALAAACATFGAGIAPEQIAQELLGRLRVPGRFEIVHRAPVVAVDYAHTPDALARTCDTARRIAVGGRVLVVFGAGGGRDEGKRIEMGEAVALRADVAFITSDNPRHERPEDIAAAIQAGFRHGPLPIVELDRATAIERALSLARPNDVVVVAGKGHEDGQTIGDETRPFSDASVVAGYFL